MAKDSKQMTGYLYVLAAAVLWSLIGPFSKICMEEGLAPLEVAFWRALLGGVCFFAQTGICGGARIPLKHALFFCAFGVLSISVFFSSLQISIQLSGAATAMVLLYTAPAWVAVFSRILFHESFSSRKGIALALALFPFVDFAPTRSWTAWANLLALGVVTNYGAYLAYGRSLQIINQVKAAIIGNIEPVLATFWVWLFWNENFSAYGWAGSALVISAVFLLTADRS